MSEHTLPSITGYNLTAQLYAGLRTAVYRAVGEHHGEPVVIKVLRSPSPSFNEIVRFRNQYIIAKNLNSSNIVKPLALVPWKTSYALVMEDVGGISLRSYLQTHKHLSVEQVMTIALQMADSLHHLSQHQVLHKDINPANILIHPDTHQVWLTDFSLASLLPKESQELRSPSSLEGTLAYIAPEQTGRMNRGIDYRTDFYSLGVTLYELLTGELPFQSDDPNELIHSHIAKVPVPPCEVGSRTLEVKNPIPNSLSDIVLKLMAKNAEDRYQSALGLKHDLQQGLSQWEVSGQIESFELGMQDRCDRFLMPEKFYGREADVQMLLDAFERVAQGASELMLVAGYSGVGKTAVVNEVHKPIVKKRGYFIKGKYDQFNRNIPFSAFVQAFRDLMGQLLGESDAQLQAWKAKILATVGENGQVLIDVIPELETIIGSQPTVPELSGTAAQNRFNRLFEKFIAVFTTQDHPLVMFLDDLQWVDAASLSLLNVLMGDNQTGYLLLLGAYRDNEVFPAHPLMLALGELENQKASISTITLAPLSASHINQLMAETLRCTLTLARPLTDLVYQKTKGNPFFTVQFLKGLYGDELIIFDRNLGHWECDLVQVQAAALTNDVVKFMARQLYKLSEATQTVLKLAACIGNQFDLETLAIVCEKPLEDVAADLWSALKAGLVVPQSQSYKFFQEWEQEEKNVEGLTVGYRFLHDRIQQAAYNLIPDSEKAQTHYKIGQQLVWNLPLPDQPTHIFKIISHLNAGTPILSTPAEREYLAKLNLNACQKAKSATAYRAGYEYAKIGLSLLEEYTAWQQQYDITLALHNALAELALLCGEFSLLETTVKTVVDHTESVLEQIPAYLALIQGKIFQNQRFQAIEISLHVLEELGHSVSSTPTQADVIQQLQQVTQLLGERPIADLGKLPIMTDATAIAIVKMATAVIPSTYAVIPLLCPILAALAVEQSIRFGNTGLSAYAYSTYGFVVCNVLKDIRASQQFGQLAQDVVDQLDAQPFKSPVLMVFGGLILHRYAHVRDTFTLLRTGYISGLDVGDLESAGINGQLLSQHLLCSGKVLEEWTSEVQNYYNSLIRFHQLTTASYCQLMLGAARSLQGHSLSPVLLAENVRQESDIFTVFQSESDGLGLGYFYIYKQWLYYLFGELELAQSYGDHARENLLGVTGLISEGLFLFLDSLTLIARFEGQDALTLILEQVDANQQGLIQHWASHAPMNYQHKIDLVNAEKYRILGQKTEAIDYYDRAITGARKNEYIQEEALANELAARFYLDWGKEKIAAVYMQEAYFCYERWGAKAKTNDLEHRYASLLAPILKQRNGIDPLATLHSIAPLSLSVHSSSSSSQPTTDSFNTVLDLATILKSAQALSASIGLNELLKKLAPMMLQTSGAERLALLLPDADNTWQVKVTATAETIQLVSDPMTDNPHLPVQLLQYVQRTQEVLVVDGLSQSLPVVDPYLQDHPHRSVLCLPLLHQTKLIGLLYLEHHSVAGVFSRDRITVLNFLCAQAAISLENALLNQTLEQKLETQTTKRQASENRLRNMVDNIPGVVYRACFNADGTDSISYISPNCHGLYGVSVEDMMSGPCSLRDFEHSEDSSIIDQILTDVNQTLQPFDHQFRIITPSGTLKWVHVIARPSPQPDGSTFWDGVVMDVSDRKRLEQETDRLIQILQATPDFIGICQPPKGILWQNQQFRNLRPDLNIFEEQVQISELYPQWAFDIVRDEGLPTAIQQGTWSGETALLTPSGDEIPTSQVIIAHKSEQGEVEYLSTILRDISDRKAIERQLEFTQYGLDHAADCFYCLDEEANIVQVNHAACQRTGYTKDQLLNLAFHELTPTCPKETTWQPHWEKLKRLKSYSFESVQKTATGEIFPVEVVCNYLEFDGKAYDFELIRDITARKVAEQELILTKFAIDNAATGILWINSKGRLTRVNESACISLGYGREELKQLSIWDITPDIQAEDWSEHWATMRSKIHARYETYYQTQDGRVYPIEITSNYLEFDGMGHQFVQFQDISDRKQAERALQLSEARANATFEQAEVGIVEGSFIDGKITRTNNCFCHMTGYIDQELKFLAIEDLTHPEDLSDFQDRIQQLYSGEIDSFTVEKRCIPKDQSYFWVNATVSLIQNPEEASPHWFAVVQDISDRKATELVLQETQTQLHWLTENIPGMIFRYVLHADNSPEFTYVSSYIRELYEMTPEEVMRRDKSPWDIVHPDDFEYLASKIQESAQTLQPINVEHRFIVPQKGLRWGQNIGRPEQQDNGDIVWHGVSFDITDRKDAELALENAQAKFHRMTENVPGMLYRCVLHPDGSDEMTYVSSQIREIFELAPETVLEDGGLSMWERTHPDDIARIEADIQTSAKKLHPFKNEHRLVLPEKGLRWIQAIAQPERLNNGDVVWDGVVIDISDRKQAEQQLQELSERLELAVESAHLGIWVWDHQDNHLTWDDRMFEIYGVPPEEFGGNYEDWANRVHPEDLVQLEAQTPERVIGSANTYTQEFRVIRPDSTIRYILATAAVQRDNEGQPIRSVGMNLDMTDRKEAEQALLQQQTHLSALLNNIPHFTWLKDADGRYIAVNDTYEELCGISMDKIVGRTDDDLWSTELASSYQADDAQVLASGQRKSIVEQFSRADGTLGWLETTKTPFKDEQGKWAGTVGIAADITDRKIAEAKLQRTNEELLRATQHKSEFLASMSHELRTPLNAVLGYSQLLQQDHSFSHDHHKQVDAINRNGEHLLALINNILEMSKIEAGKITLNPSQVDLLAFLGDIRETFIAKTKAKNIGFEVVFSPEMPRYIQVDAIKLRQILFNLMSNALKFTQEGQISFHTQVLDRDCKSSPEKIHLQFTVSDTGPGIEVENLDNIFKPFIQSASGQQHHQGTGLGLPISRQLAQMMGGTIRVDSTLGRGSAFLCDIYVQEISPDNKSRDIKDYNYQNIQGLKSQHLSYRLLIVDDIQDNRDFLARMLSMPGFEVHQAVDGSQAVEMNESWQPHLIFMDINMPHMGGLEATRLILQSNFTPKIIAISASAFADDQDIAFEAGCDDFLAKPFTVEQLFEKIANHLDVEFTTEKDPQPITQSPLHATQIESNEALILEGFKAMPVEWQNNLKQSIHRLDEHSIEKLLGDVSANNREMVDAISNLLYDFRFDVLINILEERSTKL